MAGDEGRPVASSSLRRHGTDEKREEMRRPSPAFPLRGPECLPVPPGAVFTGPVGLRGGMSWQGLRREWTAQILQALLNLEKGKHLEMSLEVFSDEWFCKKQ